MRATITTTAVTTGLLGATVIVTFLLPDSLSVPVTIAGGATSEVRLTGIVRDFQRAHPDFDVVPAGGLGHYAGNTKRTLGPGGRPVFTPVSGGGGLEEVTDLIAYWSFDEGAGTSVADSAGSNDGTLEDGPTWVAGYRGSAVHFDGTDDHVEIATPDIQISGDITFTGWFKLDADFDAGSPMTMVIMEKFLDTEHDFHVGLAGFDYNRPEVPKGAMVFKVENGPTSDYYRYKWTNRTSWTAGVWYHFAATLDSSDTASNKLFIDGADDTAAADAGGIGFIDTDYDAPFHIGGKTIDYNGLATDIYFEGSIDDVMIFSRALVEDDVDLSGGYKVSDQWVDGNGSFMAPHRFEPDGPDDQDACGNELADVAGTAGANGDGGISSPGTFATWFRDVPGSNLSTFHAITLVRDGGGVFSYLDDDFHPIDGRLFGNEAEPNNNYFTYALQGSFEYKQCWAQFVEFQGGDGAWVFIDGKLVIDIGGVDASDWQRVDIDRLDLTDGESYTMQVFYAQRQSTNSAFRIRTTLDLVPSGLTPTVSAGFD